MNRRQYLSSAWAIFSTATLAGCGSLDQTTNEGARRTTESIESIVLKYTLSYPKTHNEIPNAVIEGSNPDRDIWVVVHFNLESGDLASRDVLQLTQVNTGGSDQLEPSGTNHSANAILLTSPQEKTLTSAREDHMISEGASGKIYYQMSGEPENPEWVIDQLQNKYNEAVTLINSA